MEVQQRDPCETCGPGIQYEYVWEDYDGFASLGPCDIDQPFGMQFAPSYVPTTPQTQQLSLGTTYDEIATSLPVPCNDVRDLQIKEYTTYYASYKPVCADFTWIFAWTYPGTFSFQQLTPDESTGGGQFAILQTYMATNLRQVFNAIAASPTATSGYRNPAAEKNAAVQNGTRYVPSSRHMASDAVDLRTGVNQNTYLSQTNAAHTTGACVDQARILLTVTLTLIGAS